MSDPDRGRPQREVGDPSGEPWHGPRFSGLRRGFAPQADCFRAAGERAVTVVVELPGVDPSEVRIDALPGVITVSGERRRPPIDGPVYQLELEYGPFERRIAVPPDVDAGRARATYERGLLTIVLPLAERDERAFTVRIDGGAQ